MAMWAKFLQKLTVRVNSIKIDYVWIDINYAIAIGWESEHIVNPNSECIDTASSISYSMSFNHGSHIMITSNSRYLNLEIITSKYVNTLSIPQRTDYFEISIILFT